MLDKRDLKQVKDWIKNALQSRKCNDADVLSSYLLSLLNFKRDRESLESLVAENVNSYVSDSKEFSRSLFAFIDDLASASGRSIERSSSLADEEDRDGRYDQSDHSDYSEDDRDDYRRDSYVEDEERDEEEKASSQVGGNYSDNIHNDMGNGSRKRDRDFDESRSSNNFGNKRPYSRGNHSNSMTYGKKNDHGVSADRGFNSSSNGNTNAAFNPMFGLPISPQMMQMFPMMQMMGMSPQFFNPAMSMGMVPNMTNIPNLHLNPGGNISGGIANYPPSAPINNPSINSNSVSSSHGLEYSIQAPSVGYGFMNGPTIPVAGSAPGLIPPPPPASTPAVMLSGVSQPPPPPPSRGLQSYGMEGMEGPNRPPPPPRDHGNSTMPKSVGISSEIYRNNGNIGRNGNFYKNRGYYESSEGMAKHEPRYSSYSRTSTGLNDSVTSNVDQSMMNPNAIGQSYDNNRKYSNSKQPRGPPFKMEDSNILPYSGQIRYQNSRGNYENKAKNLSLKNNEAKNVHSSSVVNEKGCNDSSSSSKSAEADNMSMPASSLSSPSSTSLPLIAKEVEHSSLDVIENAEKSISENLETFRVDDTDLGQDGLNENVDNNSNNDVETDQYLDSNVLAEMEEDLYGELPQEISYNDQQISSRDDDDDNKTPNEDSSMLMNSTIDGRESTFEELSGNSYDNSGLLSSEHDADIDQAKEYGAKAAPKVPVKVSKTNENMYIQQKYDNLQKLRMEREEIFKKKESLLENQMDQIKSMIKKLEGSASQPSIHSTMQVLETRLIDIQTQLQNLRNNHSGNLLSSDRNESSPQYYANNGGNYSSGGRYPSHSQYGGRKNGYFRGGRFPARGRGRGNRSLVNKAVHDGDSLIPVSENVSNMENSNNQLKEDGQHTESHVQSHESNQSLSDDLA